MSRDLTVPRRAFIVGGTAIVAGAALLSMRRCSKSRTAPELVRPVETVPLADGQHALPRTEPVVRVRVIRGGRDALVFGDDGQWLASEPLTDSIDAEALDRTRFMPLEAPVRVERRDGEWRVRDRTGYGPDLPTTSWVLRALDETAATTVKLDGVPHAGKFVLHALDDEAPNRFDVVNHLGMESYLPGVLAGELYPHWEFQTFAAQAVAARSFASAERAHYGERRHFDLTNTTRSQMYTPDAVHPRAREAVAMTRGEVIAYGGGLVPGYYSSCCGGASADARYAIGPSPTNDLPPLRGRIEPDVCTDAPRYRWTMERSIDECTARLAAFGASRRLTHLAALTALESVEPTTRTGSGRPIAYRLHGSGGHTVELQAPLLRRGLDFATDSLPRPQRRLYASHLAIEPRAGSMMQITGQGFGHGVGLCQFGAQALAQDGMHYADIIPWYYPGSSVERTYD